MKSSASPIDIAQTIYEGFSRNDLDTVLALCAADIVVIQDPALPWGGTFHGSAGVSEFAAKLITTIDSSIEAEQLFQAGDRVVQYGRTTGTIRASGAAFDISECHLWTIRDGFVHRAEFLIDTAAMLLALTTSPTTQMTNNLTPHLGG
jgi:ketosteroid isomerase-like protein